MKQPPPGQFYTEMTIIAQGGLNCSSNHTVQIQGWDLHMQMLFFSYSDPSTCKVVFRGQLKILPKEFRLFQHIRDFHNYSSNCLTFVFSITPLNQTSKITREKISLTDYPERKLIQINKLQTRKRNRNTFLGLHFLLSHSTPLTTT